MPRALALIVVVGLVGAGCSSGGGDHKAAASPLRLGACASTYPEPATPNGGVPGLRDTFVPVTALEVRLCRYSTSGGLVGSATLGLPAATQLELEANRFATLPPGAPLPACPSTPKVNFVTFADNAHRVDVADEGGCGYITNGVLTADPTAKWLNELRRYTGPNTHDPTATTVP